MSASWSDDDSNEKKDDVSYEELADSHKKVCVKCEEFCQVGKKQKKIIATFHLEKENRHQPSLV